MYDDRHRQVDSQRVCERGQAQAGKPPVGGPESKVFLGQRLELNSFMLSSMSVVIGSFCFFSTLLVPRGMGPETQDYNLLSDCPRAYGYAAAQPPRLCWETSPKKFLLWSLLCWGWLTSVYFSDSPMPSTCSRQVWFNWGKPFLYSNSYSFPFHPIFFLIFIF